TAEKKCPKDFSACSASSAFKRRIFHRLLSSSFVKEHKEVGGFGCFAELSQQRFRLRAIATARRFAHVLYSYSVRMSSVSTPPPLAARRSSKSTRRPRQGHARAGYRDRRRGSPTRRAPRPQSSGPRGTVLAFRWTRSCTS